MPVVDCAYCSRKFAARAAEVARSLRGLAALEKHSDALLRQQLGSIAKIQKGPNKFHVEHQDVTQ